MPGFHHRIRRAVAGAGGGGGFGGLGPDDVLYLRSDSIDGSTDFTGLDLGPNSYGITTVGTDVRHESTGAVSGYGNTSLFKDTGTGALKTDPGEENFVFAANTDFTIEFWATINSISLSNYLFGSEGYGPQWFISSIPSPTRIAFYYGGFIFLLPGTTLTEGVPTHWCIDRYGTGADNLGIFLDGVSQGVVSNNNLIGADSATEGISFLGYHTGSGSYSDDLIMDGIRISNGTSLYQGNNFTPPASPPI